MGDANPLSGDHQLVPVNKSTGMAGVFIHANALNTMLALLPVARVAPRDGPLGRDLC